MNPNPTIAAIREALRHQPYTANELSKNITNSEGKPIPIGNVLVILGTAKWAQRLEDGKWELIP